MTVLTNAANDAALARRERSDWPSPRPTVVTAGVPFSVTVTAIDAAGHVVQNFVGTVGLANPSPGYFAQATSYTFTLADAGVHLSHDAEALTRAGVGQFTVTSPCSPRRPTP